MFKSSIGDRFTQSHVVATASLPSPQLCKRCSSINFEEISKRKIRGGDGEIIMDLDSVEALKASSCPLCQIFATLAVCKHHFITRRVSTRTLKAVSARVIFGLKTWDRVLEGDTNVLCVSDRDEGWLPGNDYLCMYMPTRTTPQFGVRLMSSEFFDTNFLRDCIDYCEVNHGGDCKLDDNLRPKALRLIDCQARTIVTAPVNCQYAALSYVWGSPSLDTSTRSNTSMDTGALDGCPKTITDAIDVTLKLDLKYLWIDRYCIQQSDNKDKHVQISQMDLIYANAYICLIAAAGKGPEYGLPGVNGTLRIEQPKISVGKHILASTRNDPRLVLKSSEWATRGWTYQEGILSHRRIVFTDEQVSFQCNGVHCTESWIFPLDEMDIKNRRISEFESLEPWNNIFWAKPPGSNPWEIMSFVSEYNQRRLTYPQDKINAIRGIFHSFERGPYPLYHLIGVPILPPIFWNEESYQKIPRSPEECFLIGLCWKHKEPGNRTLLFPSWSWAGWDGELSRYFGFKSNCQTRLQESNAWIERNDGALVNFPEKFEDLPEFLESLSFGDSGQFIQIEAKVCDFTVSTEADRDGVDGWVTHARIQLNENQQVEINISWDISKDELYWDIHKGYYRPIIYKAFLLGDISTCFDQKMIHLAGIIIEENEGVFKRIGCISFSHSEFSHPVLEFGFHRDFIPWFIQLPKRRIRLQ